MPVDVCVRHDRLLREQAVEMFERGFGYRSSRWRVVSIGGSDEFVECLGGGVVVEGGSGAVVRDFPISDVRALQSINRIPTMVGQTRLQPCHDRSVIQGTKHPTTPMTRLQPASPLHENC